MEALQLPIANRLLGMPGDIEQRMAARADRARRWEEDTPSHFVARGHVGAPNQNHGRGGNGKPLTPRQQRRADRPAALRARKAAQEQAALDAE